MDLYKCSGENCPFQSTAMKPDACCSRSCPYYTPIPTSKPWLHEFEGKDYESPIRITITPPEYSHELTDMVVKVAQGYGVSIDKDELVKALRYDRDQYQKGFDAGKQYILNKIKSIMEGEE